MPVEHDPRSACNDTGQSGIAADTSPGISIHIGNGEHRLQQYITGLLTDQPSGIAAFCQKEVEAELGSGECLIRRSDD